MVKIGLKYPIPPVLQPDATINVTDPASGQKYEWQHPPGTPLGTQKNVRIISIAIRVTWTVQPTPLEIHIALDGRSIIHSQIDPGPNTWYYAVIQKQLNESSQTMETPSGGYEGRFLWEGRSVKVEAEITGGTVSHLSARVKWAKWI